MILMKALINLGVNGYVEIPNNYNLDDYPNGIICEGTLPEKDKVLSEITNIKIQELKEEINKRATSFVKRQLDELDYDSEGEVALYASNPNSQWHDEAVALQKWIEDVYSKMYELIDSINETNYQSIDLDKIEAEYPKFTPPAS